MMKDKVLQMSIFSRKKKQSTGKGSFDPARQKAILRCSICTGEQVAGFKDLETGKFEEVMLIRNASDLLKFQEEYGVREVFKEY